MRLLGRIEIAAYGARSKSARKYQAFLVTLDGDRLLLRRYDGPSMRDAVLEAMAGSDVEADGMLRDRLFVAKRLRLRRETLKARDGEKAPSASGGKSRRRS
jgi:hypothetical protein